jgi:acetolactate synthase-1/2/3 large subunit
MIGRNFPIELGIVAETGATIDAMCELGSQRPPAPSATTRLTLIDCIKHCEPFADPDGRRLQPAPIHPAALMAVVEEEMNAAVKQRQEAKGNAAAGHIFCDCGNCVGWSLNNIVVNPPLRFHSTLNMGPMGFAVAAVVGGKLADPDAPCLAIVGDGAFLMHGAEVSTAARYKQGAVWVVLCDDDLRMVSQGLTHDFPQEAPWYGPDSIFRLGAPNLVQFAESLGARAVGITAAQDLAAFRAALRTALSEADRQPPQPQVIVVEIDPRPAPPYGWLQAPVPASAFVPAQPYPFVQAPF